MQRSQNIEAGSISYNFHIALTRADGYSGYTELTFSLKSIPPKLTLDFKGKPTKVIQNGSVLTHEHPQYFIALSVEKLKVGRNVVVVHYENVYDNDGSGCVSFTDVDGKQYIYTQF